MATGVRLPGPVRDRPSVPPSPPVSLGVRHYQIAVREVALGAILERDAPIRRRRCHEVPSDRGDGLGVPELADPGQIDVAACRSTITKGRSGKWSPTTISIVEITVATSRERMAAHRERRYKSLLQRTVTIAEADLAAIASCGHPDVMSDDKVRAAQAPGLFISDTVACLDVQR